MAELAISAKGLSKKYCADLRRSLRYGASDIFHELTLRGTSPGTLRPGEFWAVQDVSFDLAPQQSLGIIGRNGAGKSTLLRILAGVTKPDAGEVAIRGRVGSLLSLGAGFNPTLTGRENILVEGAALGMSRKRITSLLDEIIDFSELGSFIDAPVHTYSSGMRMRLGFAVATSLDADILLLDEILIVGDINFRRKSVEHINRFLDRGGSIVFVSHEMWLVQTVCSEALHLQAGRAVAQGDLMATINHYYEELDLAQRTADVAHAGAGGAPEVVAGGGTDEELDPTGASEPGRPPIALDRRPAVAIRKVAITGPDGGPVQTGDPAEIELTVEVNEDDIEAWWGFTIWTPDRVVCITTQGTAQDIPPIELPRGTHQLRSTILHMPLMGGSFQLGAAVMDERTQMPLALHGHEDAATLFVVKAPDNPRVAMQKTAGAVIDVEVSWSQPISTPELGASGNTQGG